MKPINRRPDLDDIKLKEILKAERAAAIGTVLSSDLSEQRMRNYDYYMGDMSRTMPAEQGQSSAVSSDVQDVVEGVLPIVLDLLSAENIVEFAATGPEDETQAQQETDVVSHVFWQENPGFMNLSASVKDALLSKNGVIKWWMEDEEDRVRESYKGLTEAGMSALAADSAVEIVDTEQYQDTDPATGQPTPYYNAVAQRVRKRKVRKVMAIPPEEFIFSRKAIDIANSPYLAHIRRMARADAMGLWPDKKQAIQDSPVAMANFENGEAANRQTVQDGQDNLQASTSDVNKDMAEVEIAEHYIRLPLEQDMAVRRYKVTTINPSYEILEIEEVTAWNFATGTPIIMPHRVIGRAMADLVVDIQEINTSLLRATLNSAYFANNQRMEVPESHAGENTIDDLLNNRVGGIVRTKIPGGIKTIENQPIGNWIMGVIEHIEDVREKRTGVSRYNQGLDGDSLNPTFGGLTRIMDAAEMRIKLIARTLAETMLVDTFRGIQQMCAEYDEEQRAVETTGGWIQCNPREWKRRQYMKVTMPLGGASKQMLLQFCQQLLGVQKDIVMQQGGMNGPLVSAQNIYNTIQEATKLAGMRSVKPYLMQPPPPNPNAPPPPNPRMIEAQGKVQAIQEKGKADIAIKQQSAQAEMALDAQQAKFDMQLDAMRAQLEAQRENDIAQREMLMDRVQSMHDMMVRSFETGHALRLSAHESAARTDIARDAAKNRPQPND